MKSAGKRADGKGSKVEPAGKRSRSAKRRASSSTGRPGTTAEPAPVPRAKRSSGELTTRKITLALDRAVYEALRVHKLLGQSVVTWRDGKVVWVAPEDIPVDVIQRRAPRRAR
jgi:hypothetical protein